MNEVWKFVEEILAEDHPSMAKQIRRYLNKLVRRQLKKLRLLQPPSIVVLLLNR